MTSVVGILNKYAVALAADSAVTIDGIKGRKIFNGANKVFTLSKHHPVGIMIYNSASIMGTPWEIVIKLYRKTLKQTAFPTIKAYQDDFLKFLREKHFFASEEDQKKYIGDIFHALIDSINKEALQSIIMPPEEAERNAFILEQVELKVDNYLHQLEQIQEVFPEFHDYSIEEFNIFLGQTLNEKIDLHYTNNGFVTSQNLKDKIARLFHQVLKKKEQVLNYTGLIFVGFGEDEIYPQLIPANISLAVQNRLRYFVDNSQIANISNTSPGAIRPFAQTDVINTILTGIDPMLDITYIQNFTALFKKYNDEIIAILGGANPALTAQIQALDVDLLAHEYAQKNLETKQSNYIIPLMNAVSSLSKEDLAEMAESLIYLTYLKRRITFAEESVGGPVDVAIISKGDGFIWIKRKHYFKPELNQHFFDNYFNA